MAERSQRIMLDNPEIMKKVNSETLKYFNKYIVDLEIKELSPATILNYSSDLRQWFCYIYTYQSNESVLNLDDDDISEFIYYCKKLGNNTQRIKRRISSISAFYIYLCKKRIVQINPVTYIDRPKGNSDPIVTQTFLTREQVDEMKQKLRECGDIQLLAYAVLSLSTMARINAIAHLKWEQCDFDTRVFENVLEKEGKRVTLYFSNECRDVLGELIQYRKSHNIEDGGYVFCNDNGEALSNGTFDKWCKRIGSMINIPTLHPHDFRHSGAQLLSLAGMPLEDISTLLNHAGTDVTIKHYLRPDKKKIQEGKDKYEI